MSSDRLTREDLWNATLQARERNFASLVSAIEMSMAQRAASGHTFVVSEITAETVRTIIGTADLPEACKFIEKRLFPGLGSELENPVDCTLVTKNGERFSIRIAWG